MRIFMPDLARQMKAEGTLDVFGQEKRELQETDYIRVIDNGADVTIFAFSGLDVLYAGLARFEFQNVLKRLGKDANMVFVRDIHRLGFHLTPDGTPDGGEFFVQKINEVKAQLGASHNVAIGSSIGGSAAFYFGSRCGMEQLIIFGAAFTVDGYTKPSTALRTFTDFKKLFTEPSAYFELVLVTIGASWARRQLINRVGEEKLGNPLQAYAETDPKPRITVFYGGTAWPDVAQALMLKDYPTAYLNPLPTGRHNTPAFLKKHGSLGDLIGREIRAALPEHQREALSEAV
jgi:hypothetical protein